MVKKPVLVVMAAGMGSRYGGLKQIDPVGSCGEAILDYSLYDAYKAGFETAVIIIKHAIEVDFMETVGARLKACPMEIRYAFQEIDKLPAGFTATLDALTSGASVAVNASGAFTKAHTSAASFLQYFRAAVSGKTISVKDNVLYCN